MAENKVVISVDVEGNATEKTQSLRAQMKALRDELGKLPEGTAEYNKVARQLGELTDKVGDLGKEVGTLAGDPLERLNNSFGMIGSSIMSLDFGAAQTGLKGMTAAVKDFKIKDAGEAAKGFGKTMFDLGKALMTNPIFLLGGIIAAVVTNFEELTKAGGLIGNVFGFIKNAIDSVIGGLVDFMDWIGLTDTKADERAENEKKRAEEQKKQRDEELKKAKEVEAEKEKLAKEAAAKEAQRIQKIRDDQKSLNDFLKSEREKRHQETLTEQERELRQLQLTYDEKKRLAHGDAALLKSLNEEYQKEIQRINTNYANKRAQDELAIAKKTNELLKQIKLEGIAEEEALAQEIQNIAQGEQATELQNLRDSYFEKIELAKKYGLDSLVLEEDLKKKEEEIREKYKTKEVEQEKLTAQQKVDIAFAVAGNLMSIMDSLGKQDRAAAKRRFNINKAFGITQATINTYMAVNAALTAGGNPIKLATGAQFVEAGIALTMGLANVAKIASTKFNDGGGSTSPSGGGGGGGMGALGGGGSTAAPALDLSFLNNAQTKAQPIQSYVLATNVTSAQDAQQKIIDQAKLIK
jgi:hypothetical protein